MHSAAQPKRRDAIVYKRRNPPHTTAKPRTSPGHRRDHDMSLQIPTPRLDGITAGDYLTRCHDCDPPAHDHSLRSIRTNTNAQDDTIIAILDWNQLTKGNRGATMRRCLVAALAITLTVACTAAASARSWTAKILHAPPSPNTATAPAIAASHKGRDRAAIAATTAGSNGWPNP